MPWYLRKSLTRGPVRLNLSKSGLGASFGVKGLRIGVGPKGTYLQGGRGGLYYRQYLNSRTPGGPALAPTGPLESPIPQVVGEPTEHTATPANDDDVAAAINQRLSAFRWSRALVLAAFVVPVIFFANQLPALAVIAFVALLVWAIALSTKEAKQRRITLDYQLPEETLGKYYAAFVHAFEEASKCAAIWRVTSQAASYQTKYTAGAGMTVQRSLTRITFNEPTLTVNIPTAWLWAAGGKLALLPDRMLFFGPQGVSSLKYTEVNATASDMNFREDGVVPPDSTNVGTTWQYVNKNGGPDKRFANNRQLPIQRYSDFRFTHPSLGFLLEFSRAGIANVLVMALKGLANVNDTTTFQGGSCR